MADIETALVRNVAPCFNLMFFLRQLEQTPHKTDATFLVANNG